MITPCQLEKLMAWIEQRLDDIAHNGGVVTPRTKEARRQLISAFGFVEGRHGQPKMPSDQERLSCCRVDSDGVSSN